MKVLSFITVLVLVSGHSIANAQDAVSTKDPCENKKTKLLQLQTLCGAGSRGGGDATAEGPTAVETVIDQVSHLKQPVRYALNNIENMQWGLSDKTEAKLIHLFFNPPAGRKTYLDALSEVHFKPKLDGLCVDLQDHNKPHKLHDASAFNADPKEICMAVESIASKTRQGRSLGKTAGWGRTRLCIEF